METIRLSLAFAAHENWLVHHLDVKSAFLNGELREEVYVTQPTGFEVKGRKDMVYRLYKALYGLRQAPRAWNAELDRSLKELGFSKCTHEQAIYKEAYARKLLDMVGMKNCNPTKWPMQPKLQLTKDEGGREADGTKYRKIKGSLIYLIHIRPDLSYSVGVVSRYMQNPKESHYAAVKQILRYIRGAVGYGLKYGKGGDGKLLGYSDSSYGMDKKDRRGTTSIALYYSGNLITWSSQKQNNVALSSCEAEFMATTAATCQGLWLRNLVSDLLGKKAKKVNLLLIMK